MDSSEEEILALYVLVNKRKKQQKAVRSRAMWCRQHFLVRPILGEYHRTFRNLVDNPDIYVFFNYTRMSYDSFRELKGLLEPHISPTGSNWWTPVAAEHKLVLTLRYLATGCLYAAMSAPFHMARSTISIHVCQTCEAIWQVLQPLEMPKPTEEDWIRLAERYGSLWDYPFAIGSLDGKHIALENPANSGSMYYNYKGFPSIVLLALSDADSCFTLIDCGQYGRISDAGVFQASIISQLFNENRLNIPKDLFTVNASMEDIPYVIVGDEAFRLKCNLMRPYAARTLNAERRIYNYRHSRARHSVECAFGILAKKFDIFKRPMRLQPDKAIVVTKAATVLHNFIRRRDGHMVDRTSDVRYDQFKVGDGEGMIQLRKQHASRAPQDAVNVRNAMCSFFSDPQGRVTWQDEHVFRNVITHDGND